MPRMKPLVVTDEQVLFFRARRSFVAGPGAGDPVQAASTVLGAQSQVEAASLYALAMRTAGRPTAAEVKRLLFEGTRELVRTWGQRDTLHLYAYDDLAVFVAAQRLWPASGRRGGMPPKSELARLAGIFEQAATPLTRSDLVQHISPGYVATLVGHPGAGDDPARFAATRIIWCLSTSGRISHADRSGAEQRYVSRRVYDGDRNWLERDPEDACVAITCRYLSVFGPATANDVAHYLGARVSDTRRWLGRLEGELATVHCGPRKGLVMLARDVDDLCRPVDHDVWPARLLASYDTQLMTHADKTWVTPNAGDRPAVWAKAARVAATVLHRGRVVATWTYEVRRKVVVVDVAPLSLWSPGVIGDIERDAADLARHLGHAAARVVVPE
jgi:hypothetical protein